MLCGAVQHCLQLPTAQHTLLRAEWSAPTYILFSGLHAEEDAPVTGLLGCAGSGASGSTLGPWCSSRDAREGPLPAMPGTSVAAALPAPPSGESGLPTLLPFRASGALYGAVGGWMGSGLTYRPCWLGNWAWVRSGADRWGPLNAGSLRVGRAGPEGGGFRGSGLSAWDGRSAWGLPGVSMTSHASAALLLGHGDECHVRPCASLDVDSQQGSAPR